MSPTATNAMTLDAAAARPPPADRHGTLPFVTAARWAVLVAACMSTQYLFQPFVWRNWPPADVLLGWTEVLRDRLIVALAIAFVLAVASRVPLQRAPARAAAFAVAIIAGAAAGEFALHALGSAIARDDVHAMLGSALRWSGVALCAAGIYLLWRRHDDARAASRTQELLRSQVESARVQTELEALRRQIESHFLFNTLATVRHLREAGPDDGRRLLRHLREYLGAATPSARAKATLGDEIDLVASYLAIVAIRMGGRLTVRFDVPAALRGCECPPLALATLVENAVKHGITPAAGGGEIHISATREAGTLEMSVADTGVGIDGVGAALVGGAGIGLASTRARLLALYGDAASLRVLANAPRGVRAVIRLPLRVQGAR
jgi:signal transduction histidine kinase